MRLINIPISEKLKILLALRDKKGTLSNHSLYCSSGAADFEYNENKYYIEECFEKIVKIKKYEN